jgi:omega-6 fatty acid desaturase (delta-12 desaturase)
MPAPKKDTTASSADARRTAYDERVPPVPQAMSLAQLRAGVPKQFFERSALKSFAYLARDMVQIFGAVAVMYYYIMPFLDSIDGNSGSFGVSFVKAVKAAAWSLYWFAQATNFCAVWVLAGHEGGHGAFSTSTFINELVGFTFHSLLLVPYHSWRVTHAHHHKYTNHLSMDTAFIPDQKEEPLKEAIMESPIVSFGKFLSTITVGWPMYFIFNVWGRQVPGASNMTHYLPNSGYFQSSDRGKVILSDICLMGVLAALGMGVTNYGWWPVLAYYFLPYMGCNAWLVFITFMHHHDVRIAHFNEQEFTYVRGATSAIDRDYGWLINPWIHHINDSHVVHHIWHEMPFYNAIQATPHIKKLLGASYLEDHRPVWTQLWESWCGCRYIVPTEGVAYFRK